MTNDAVINKNGALSGHRMGLIATVVCLALLVLGRLQLMLIIGGINERLLTSFAWGVAYDLALALGIGGFLSLLVSFGVARLVPYLGVLLLAGIQLFELANVLFYRFFGFHIDLKFREYMTVSNTVSIRDSILHFLRAQDIVFCLMVPIGLIGVGFYAARLSIKSSQSLKLRSLAFALGACFAALLFNYVGNIAPSRVRHDPTGLGLQPIFRVSRQFFKRREKEKQIHLVQSIPTEVMENFNKFYNISSRWKSGSAGYPWMREPVGKRTSFVQGSLKKKNIVFVFLESFGAMSVTPLSPVFHDVTPELSRLRKSGAWFTHAYMNVNPTAPAESAVLCSLYSDGSILNDFKTNLSCAGNILAKYGYFTNFIGGNGLNYDNQYAFWLAHGFKSIIDESSFWLQPTHPNVPGHWGKYVDGDVFDEASNWMEESAGKAWPFFLVVKTASSHSPYPEVDERYRSSEGVNADQRQMNGAMKYVDHELGRFIDHLKTRPYYKDTIFFIFGDHPPNEVQSWPGGEDYNSFVPHAWVPLLVLNPVQLENGQQIDWPVSHVDLLPTVLDMVGISEPAPYAGHSMIDRSVPPEKRYVYVLDRARGRRGLITTEHAYVQNYHLRVEKFFDLRSDPYSRKNIVEQMPFVAQKYDNWLKSFKYVSQWTFEHNRFVPAVSEK